ncbi:MAG TPA: tetratricopeptide repeat protein [Verrucomicrobia bacterium]|nr:tetratricopeptide repeat protein [Verrucomicrobiota bacterium]
MGGSSGIELSGFRFQPPPPVGLELDVILKSLKDVSENRFEEAGNRLRTISSQSPFSQWRLFIKGLSAFHGGDAAKATRCFQKLSTGSVPARAGKVYLWMLGIGDKAAPSMLKFVARMTGLPEPIGKTLMQIENLWKRNQYDKAYLMIRSQWREFPIGNCGMQVVLSDFIYRSVFSMSSNDSNKYLSFIESLDVSRRTRNPCELEQVLRTLCLLEGDMIPAEMFVEEWEQYLHLLEQRLGPNPIRDSLGLAWLGEKLSKQRPPDFPFFFRSRKTSLRDPVAAVHAFEKSIQKDPNNLDACLKLCDLHEKLKNKSARNRLLDSMTQRFPDRKEVLLMAGVQCLDRKAVRKGLTYLSAALEQDRLDPEIPRNLVRGCLLGALKDFKRGKTDAGRDWIRQAESHSVKRPLDYHRSRWCLLVYQSVMETKYGDLSKGGELLDEAGKQAPSVEACLFYAHLVLEVFLGVWSDRYFMELKLIAKKEASLDRGIILLQILRRWEPFSRGTICYDARAELEGYFKNAVKQPFTRSDVVELEKETQGDYRLAKALDPFARKILKQDRGDPLMRLIQLQRQHRGSGPDTSDIRKIENIQKEARKRNDSEALQRSSQLLEQLNRPSPIEPDMDFMPPMDDEDYDDGEDWSNDPLDSPEADKAYKELMDLLDGPPKKKPVKKKKKPIPQWDPAQLDLFNL